MRGEKFNLGDGIEVEAPPYFVYQKGCGDIWKDVFTLGRWNPSKLRKLSDTIDVPARVIERVFRMRSERSVATFHGEGVGSVPEDLGSWREKRRRLTRLAGKRHLTDADAHSLLDDPLCCQAFEYLTYGTPVTHLVEQIAAFGPLRSGRLGAEPSPSSALDIYNLYDLFDQPETLRPLLRAAAKINGTRNKRLPDWADCAARYMWSKGCKERQFVVLFGTLLYHTLPEPDDTIGKTTWYRNRPSNRGRIK